MGAAFWDLERLARTAGGEVIRSTKRSVFGAAIDTRSLRSGQLFFAFRGAQTDGHGFVEKAAERGAAAAFVTDLSLLGALPEGFGVVRVDDAELALVTLAKAYRDELRDVCVVGVAGSAGKTTTKELIGSVLSETLTGSHSHKSFNNRLGVSLTMLNARPDDDYLVCEIGTSSMGETAELAAIVRPDTGVLVSLGREHLEGLGGLDGIADEAAGLLEGVPADGTLVVIGDEPRLLDRTSGFADRITFGTDPMCDVSIREVVADWDGTRFDVDDAAFCIALLGVHNASNAGAAIAVGRAFGLSDEAIRAGLARAAPAPMRLEPQTVAGIRVINDAYNAHPESMAAAIRLFASLPTPDNNGERVLVLGDMLELASEGPALHEEAARLIVQSDAADRVLLVGKLAGGMKPVLDAADVEAQAFEATDEGTREAAMTLAPGDVVLLKASRGVRLERVVESLENSAGTLTER
ncbi:MAG: UDP-N-acetylmuramoyl-tripeptide--D-alanyl-D-alanine ligase [Planctomycetota bacterium]